MGNIFTYQTKKLCEDCIDDTSDFMINVNIYTIQTLSENERKQILEYFQFMHPYASYMHLNSVHLLFRPGRKSPFIRSNMSGELISYISSELSIWMIKILNRDPRLVDVHITCSEYTTLLNNLSLIIKGNNYSGLMYDLEILSDEKIKEKFS